ncbi:WcbI family polysaccharide biosynthesis putative acetyltransferase [Paenibacillus sp. S-38]|uniref:WcbI family polysaccharide biosynthesis putative acetyltransferase n=1 Tax=Paenibacillus sp. S-38 TaxID=3416710 RepID=UPI003CF0D5B0
MKKRKCIVYGNCQTTPLQNYLKSSPTFLSHFTIFEIPQVHHADRLRGLPNSYFTDCDLFIYQKVGTKFGEKLSTDYLLSLLPRKCIKISFTYCYFTGYFPQFVVDPDGFTYGDINVARLLERGTSKQEIQAILADENYYSADFLNSNLANTLYELRRREAGVDIQVADYIEKMFRVERLFYTYNHPRYYLTWYVAQKVLQQLEISPLEIAPIVSESYASDQTHPIYPSVLKHLNIQFQNPSDYQLFMNGYPVCFGEYMSYYIDYVKTKR